MMKRILCLCVVACLTTLLGVKAEVKVENGVYQDVLLSFAPNVENDNAQELVNSLKELLEHTSQTLYTATSLRIGTVTVRLPSTWNTSTLGGESIKIASPDLTEQKPDILVDATKENALGKNPIALQYGGCTVSGHQIILPREFLSNSDEYPKGKLLAREWLKYRYGVFDENGFKGDEMYPEYYRVPGSSEIRITECTSPEVNFYFKDPTTGNNCSMDIPADFDNCKVHPEEDANVTSSLMYYYEELKDMEHICGGQNHNHKENTLSKHNTLCNGASIWDVLKKSLDFSFDGPFEEYKPVELSFVQDSSPRVVLFLENSDKLFKKQAFIEFGVMRLLNDLPSQSRFGVYYFTKDVSVSRPFTDLSSRDLVDGFGDFGYNDADTCTSCALTRAVGELLKDNFEGEKGKIILITHSNFNGDVSDLKERVGISQLCITIIRFVDDDSSGEETYEHLKEIFSCYSYHGIILNAEDGESFEHFYNYMNADIPKPTYDYQIEEVTSWSMSAANPLIIPMDPIASYFTLWLSGSVDSGSIQCKMGDANVMLEQKIRKSTISAYNFEAIHDAANDVSCVQKSATKPPLLTQVQKTSVKGHYFDFDVWYHDTTPSDGETQMPVIIYVKINYGGYPVVDANVTGIVTAPNDEKTEVQFLDNGKGDPDITKHDGLYSGYFTNFVDKGGHTLNVIVSYKESETMTGKKGADICCGSQVSSEMSDAPSFKLTKEIVIESKSKKPDDGYPPSRILDLKVIKFDPPTAITLGWTAPGGGEVASYILKLFNSRDDALKNFESSGKVLNTTQITDSYYNKQENYELSLSELEDNATGYIALQALNEKKKAGETSTILEFFLPLGAKDTSKNPETTTPMAIIDDNKKSGPNRKTIGIVIGVLGGIVVLCICIYLGIYFLVQKPKRKEEARAKRSQNSSDQRSSSGPSTQIGLNSIPADVIIKHHNEVVTAKNMHKDPPIFKEENLDSFNSSPELPENSNRNNNVAEYSQVQKASSPRTPDASQQDPSKSPKRMTIV